MSKQKDQKKDKLKELESYFQTPNEHFNSYTFDIYKDAIKKDLFVDPEIPLRFFNEQAQKLVDLSDHPIQAIEQMKDSLEKICDNKKQRKFLLTWILDYVTYTDFGKDLNLVKKLLSVECDKKQKVELPEKKHATHNLRDKMKSIVLAELEELPENLNLLLPKERVSFLAKFMPYIFPKMEKVDYDTGD